jgi:hypothetical protein
MNTFPRVVRDPNLIFSDESSDDAVDIGKTASGYPVLNKLVTFDARDFNFEMPCVPDADKVEIMTFYDANKDLAFYWYNKQDKVTYEVIFLSRPTCRLEGRGDLWRMGFAFRQVSP